MQQLPAPGQRIRAVMIAMGDPPVKQGAQGTVEKVREVLGELHILVVWDCGRRLNLVPRLDEYEML